MSGAPSAAELDSVLDVVLAAAGTELAPATSIGVFDLGGMLAWRAGGEPRLDGVGTERDTVFRIASMSKSFLAATALALESEGRLDLRLPITNYVPGPRFRFAGLDQVVTVDELLANRSGMPEDNAWGDRQLGASRDEIAELAAAGFELIALPGTRYQYSNLGMSLVGRAIEAVTGRSVEAEVRGRFLEPLGLAHTHYGADEFAEGVDLAYGFRTFDDGRSFTREPYVGSGALACIGALFSTIDDVARWGAFLASGFAADPQRPELLPPRARREMQRSRTAVPIPQDDPFRELDAMGYGYGMVAEHDRRFGWIAQHSGGLPGFSSHMRWHLDSGYGVVVFGNSDTFRAERAAADALARVLGGAAIRADAAAPWPAVLDAAAQIEEILRGGVDAYEAGLRNANGILATNVLLDVPADVRRSRLEALLADVGPVRVTAAPRSERILSSSDAAQLSWEIPCEQGSLRADIRLVGLSHPLVQSLEIDAIHLTPTQNEGAPAR